MRDNTPIFVSGSCITFRDIKNYKRSLVDGLDQVSQMAFKDSGHADALKHDIDAIATISFAMGMDAERQKYAPVSPGAALAKRWGLSDCKYYVSRDGGNAPQYLINYFSEKLSQGVHRTVLINNCELIATINDAIASGGFSWWPDESSGSTCEIIGSDKVGCSEAEYLHGFFPPANAFSLMESSFRHHIGNSVLEHEAYLGKVCEQMNLVARENPNAWFRESRAAEEIASVNFNNRYIAYPYTKYMCAMMSVNMAAAAVMTTTGNARRLGIPENKWVYLNGFSDVEDTLYLSERPKLYDSDALRVAIQEALEMAGNRQEDIDLHEIYTCFPVVLEIAGKILGLDPSRRSLTLAGGLPYYGGAGSSYSLHAAVHMMEALRRNPGAVGLLIAHGWYMTKESVGVYSSRPPKHEWTIPKKRAGQVNVLTRKKIINEPVGRGKIEAHTVAFENGEMLKGIIIGETDDGCRFVANIEKSDPSLGRFVVEDMIGKLGKVVQKNGRNIFQLI